MKTLAVIRTLVLLLVLANIVRAGGLERIAPTTAPLFQEGRYFEVSWANVAPELSGVGGLLDPTSGGTGDLLGSYNLFGFAVKGDCGPRSSWALMMDQPLGADTLYPMVPTSGYQGTLAVVDSDAISGIFAYEVVPQVSIYGGLRLQSIQAKAAFPFGPAIGLSGPYAMNAKGDDGVGFLSGIAYERPEIAMRVAATYYSEIDHKHQTTETVGAIVTETETALTTPQSINLEFQSGIAQDTLAFGSIRWVDWSSFAVSPPVFSTSVGQPLVAFENDWTTYTLGVGRKVCDYFSIAALCTYEPATNRTITVLGPVDGLFSYGLAPTFTLDDLTITVGVSRVELGRAFDFAQGEFDDGKAIAVGVRIGMNL